MITIQYTCDGCGAEDEEVQVIAREEPQDVFWWMKDIVTAGVSLAHSLKSPNCQATTMRNIKIPLPQDDNNAWIGKQTGEVPSGGK